MLLLSLATIQSLKLQDMCDFGLGSKTTDKQTEQIATSPIHLGTIKTVYIKKTMESVALQSMAFGCP